MAINRAKTVHGAAKELGITQTGVTQRIRSLESSLQTTLFIRSRRGMLLTEAGEALHRYCLSARDLEGPVLAKIQGAGLESEVRICVTGPTSIMRTRVIPQSIELLKRFPGLLLHHKISDAPTWVEDLRSGLAQVALVPPDLVAKEMESRLLRSERYVLIGPRRWKGRPLVDVVRTERSFDFDPSDQQTFNDLRKYKLLEGALPERHFVNNNEALGTMIESGLGYGVLTEEFAERFLQRCDIALLNGGKSYEQPMALAWYPRPESSKYWNDLLKAIR